MFFVVLGLEVLCGYFRFSSWLFTGQKSPHTGLSEGRLKNAFDQISFVNALVIEYIQIGTKDHLLT